jgi:hypothetical protein
MVRLGSSKKTILFLQRKGGPSKPKPTTQCAYCPKVYDKTYALHRHCNQMHPEEVASDWYQCGMCKVYLPTERTLTYHKTHGDYISFFFICLFLLVFLFPILSPSLSLPPLSLPSLSLPSLSLPSLSLSPSLSLPSLSP